MGNIAIIIRAVGVHHNGLSYDQEQLAKRFVDEMRAAGHSVLTAHVEGNGSVDVAAPGAYLSPVTKEVDYFARAAYALPQGERRQVAGQRRRTAGVRRARRQHQGSVARGGRPERPRYTKAADAVAKKLRGAL